jgi:spore maturation protein B
METFRTYMDVVSTCVVPLLIAAFPLYGLWKRVPVYEEFVTGAKEGFNVAVRIIPYIVAILVAVGMFRASGGMDILQGVFGPVLRPLFVPPELVPMAVTRPLTGGGSLGVLADMIKTYGIDSPFVKMAATLYGSTETTFYIIAVYFGAAGIKKTRHALPAGLIAELAAVLFASWIIRLMYM